jgi:hypothetical protein
VGGTLGSQFAYNAFTNNPASSEWVIPHTAFGEYDVQPTDLSDDELFNDGDWPEFLNAFYYTEYVAYGDQYIVGYFEQESFIYNGNVSNYDEYRLSIMSSTGVSLWTYAFDYTESYAIGAYYAENMPININHMMVEGDTLIILMEFSNRITYYDPFTETINTVGNGDGFNIIGGGEDAKDYIQSFIRFNLVTKTFHVVGVSEADTPLFDSEDFERVEPFRYAFAQEFDNLDGVAFTHNYYGETLTFTEQTNSIALLTEVTVHPTQFAATFQTIGKWSSTSGIDIDVDSFSNTKQEYVEIEDTGFMHIDIALTLDNDLEKDNLANNVMTAVDDLLTNDQQTFINNASSRYTQDMNLERLQYQIVGVIDSDFNKVSIDIIEEFETFSSNEVNSAMYIYWVKDRQFVYISNEEEFNEDGLKVRGHSIIRFKNGNTVTKTFDMENYGDISIFEFIMDDSGNMIIGGHFVSSETNPIQAYDRTFVLFMNKDFQILDDLIIDGDGVGNYYNTMFIDENEIRLYVNIQTQSGLFANIPVNVWTAVITIALV